MPRPTGRLACAWCPRGRPNVGPSRRVPRVKGPPPSPHTRHQPTRRDGQRTRSGWRERIFLERMVLDICSKRPCICCSKPATYIRHDTPTWRSALGGAATTRDVPPHQNGKVPLVSLLLLLWRWRTSTTTSRPSSASSSSCLSSTHDRKGNKQVEKENHFFVISLMTSSQQECLRVSSSCGEYLPFALAEEHGGLARFRRHRRRWSPAARRR